MFLVQSMAGSALYAHWSGSHLVIQATPLLTPVTDFCGVGKPPEHGQDYGRTFPGDRREIKGDVAHFSQPLALVRRGRDRHAQGPSLGRIWVTIARV